MGSLSTTTTAPSESLTTDLTHASTAYHKSHPLSHQRHTSSLAHLPGGNTRTVLHTPPFPLTIASAHSATLTTLDKHTLTDFLSEYTAAIYGHSHPVIKEALLEAVDKGWNYGAQCGLEGELASLICAEERYGRGGMEMVRFVNSGTEANLLALGTAVAWTSERDRVAALLANGKVPEKRNTVLLFDKGYHGSVISGRSMPATSNSTTTPTSGAGGNPSLAGKGKTKLSLNLPYDIVVLPYNDISAIENLTKTHAYLFPIPTDQTPNLPPHSPLAAILLEPLLGSGGCFPATPQFLSTLRDLADRTGALLIFDEVMTSRLSPHGFGHTITNGAVKPDLITLGKWVGGGGSFGAFGGRSDIMGCFDPENGGSLGLKTQGWEGKVVLEHPGTFNNNVFSMRAGVAGLSKIMNREVMVELNERGNRLRGDLEGVLRKYGLGFKEADCQGVQADGAAISDNINGAPSATAVPVPGRGRPFSDAELASLPSLGSARNAHQVPAMTVRGVGSLLTIHFNLPSPEREKMQQLFWLYLVEHGYWIAARGFVALNVMLSDADCEGFVGAVEGFLGEFGGLLRGQ